LGERRMSRVKEVETLTQQRLMKILEDAYKKGSESANVTSQQLVEEISAVLKPYVKSEQ
jgi:hypothetical protein